MELRRTWQRAIALACLTLLGLSILTTPRAKKPDAPPRTSAGAHGVHVIAPGAVAGLNPLLKELAEAGGGQVRLPAGVYQIHEPIMIGGATTLRGDGPGTILIPSERFDAFLRDNKVYGAASDVQVFFMPKPSHFGVLNVKDASGARISELAIRGNRENVRTVTGVMTANASDVLIRDVTVEDCGGSGFAVLASRDVTLRDSTSRRNHNGVIIRGPGEKTGNILVTGCRISDNRWSGVYMCGGGVGQEQLKDGPRNITVTDNFVFRHMCDEGIKGFGVRDVILTGNRVDYALEATITLRGSNVVVANNICSHGDDGMNNKGNGGGIGYGNRGGDHINAVIQGNICRQGNNGIWSEGFRREGGKNLPLGRVAIVGNVCTDNVTAGIGYIMKTDLTCVGNVCVNNGHSLPEPWSPAEDTMGVIAGGGTKRTVLVGNVIADERPEAERRQKYGLILRGCDDGIAAYNYVSGSRVQNVIEQGKRPNYLNQMNGPTPGEPKK